MDLFSGAELHAPDKIHALIRGADGFAVCVNLRTFPFGPVGGQRGTPLRAPSPCDGRAR